MNVNFLFTKSILLILLLLTITSGTPYYNSSPVLPINTSETIELSKPFNILLIDSVINLVPKQYKSTKYSQLIPYIKEHEGFRSKMYYCLGGKPTIGWGHVIKSNENHLYKGVTEYEGDSILYKDVKIREQIINNLIKQDNLSINDNQKQALIHFIFALGEGTLIRSSLYYKIKNNMKINKQDFTQYCIVKNRRNKYMIKMRKWEYDLYNK